MALNNDRFYQILLKSGKKISTSHQVAEYATLASLPLLWHYMQVPGTTSALILLSLCWVGAG